MKRKNIIFWPFFFLLLPTVFFGFPSGSMADENDLIISEIMYDPAGTDTGHADWIEIYNASEKTITIKEEDFGIIDEKDLEPGSDGKYYKNCHGIDKDLVIASGKYAIIAQDDADFLKDYAQIDKDLVYDSAFSLSSSGDHIHLSLDKCATIFAKLDYEKSWGGDNNGMTLEKKKMDSDYKKDDWQESYILGGTPGKGNSEKPETKEYKNKIKLNEILPHPGNTQEEYIELYNSEKEDADLSGYILRDSSKTGKYAFPTGSKIKNLDYLVIYKSDFKFALNDSGSESVLLYDPNEKLVDEMTYNTSKENYSWNFDGSRWRLSRHMTPEKENQFEQIIEGKIKRDKEIFSGMYASFEAKVGKNAKKFTWDFGDGHKSYLKKTRHKYEKAGKYAASLKITGDGEDNKYEFTVVVENYDAPKIRIISIVPNPKGKDSGEYIVIQNKSKEKVNLLDWSIATGWKNLYNHPIRKDFILKKGESKKLTKKICAFTLNNSKTKIELRDPTGEVTQKLKYDRSKDKIEDDETFELSGKKWEWIKPPDNAENEETSENSDEELGNYEENTGDILIVPDSEIQANIGKYTSDIYWENKKDNRIILIGYGTAINTPVNLLNVRHGQVLGVSDEKYIPEEKHWAASLFDNSVRKINFGLNWVLNKI